MVAVPIFRSQQSNATEFDEGRDKTSYAR